MRRIGHIIMRVTPKLLSGDSSNQFNLNRLLMVWGVFDGKYDGRQVSPTAFGVFWCRLVFWFLFYCVVKFFLLVIGRRYPLVSFVVADYYTFEKDPAYTILACGCAVYFYWTWSFAALFQRLNWSRKDFFWVYFLPFNLDRPSDPESFVLQSNNETKLSNKKFAYFSNQLAGLDWEQFAFFQRSYLRYTRMGMKWMVFFCPFISFVVIFVYYLSHCDFFRNEFYFWWVFVFNAMLIFAQIFANLFLTMVLPSNYIFLAVMTKARFRNIRKTLTHLAEQPLTDLSAISFQVREFNLIVNDMLRINHFWSKAFAINYSAAIVNVFLFAQQVIYGDVFILRVCFLIGIVMVYSSGVLFPLYSASLVHSSVSGLKFKRGQHFNQINRFFLLSYTNARKQFRNCK